MTTAERGRKKINLNCNNIQENIKFLAEQQERLEPYLKFLAEYFVKTMDEQDLPITTAFEMFKFLTEYYVNASILLVKCKEVADDER